ncbi:MAG: tetratricopeptide repeat protein, partial [Beijerinckiaceae bacterium]|nr:tetratricopeptide repeat protein [Beijerinckiaceae bacterium]
RLEDAERLRLRPDLAGLLGASDWAYLAACRAREAEEKEREEQRRKRELLRNRIIAYGSLSALVVVSVLGWFFWQQKQEALAQRMRAEGTVIAAARGADQFIIDVADKLRETSGLPLALVSEFLKNAAKMLDQLHQYNADSPELARSRARFLREMSQTLLAANDTDSALASAEQSRDMVEKLLPQNPNDANLRHELSLAYNRIGEALSRKDRRVEALGYFRRALAIREELATADPAVEAQRDLALSYERTGDELFDSDVDEASKLYEKSFAIRERLAVAEPDNSDRREDIAVAYERLARAARKRGNDGLLLYRKILAIREGLVNADPGNARFLANLGTTYDTLGAILADEMGRCDEALDSLHKALSIRQELAAKAPDNVNWQAKLAKSMYRLSVCDDPSENWLTRASVILVKLDKDGKLPDDARDLLARIEMRLRATPSSNPKPKL